MQYRRTVRRINGERRKVKVYSDGKVRIVGVRNTTDSTAPRRLRRRRVIGFWNYPDTGNSNYRR
jgi:hypothetical protein